jgi:hypothetical protein
MGITQSKKIGYDITEFQKEFNNWKVNSLIPLNNKNYFNSIKTAIQYFSKKESIEHIYVIATEDQAFLSMLAAINQPKVSGLILINPTPVYDKGTFSLDHLKKSLPDINIPTLYFFSYRFTNHSVIKSKQILRELKKSNKNISEYILYKKPNWFWNSRNFYMNEIHHFIFGYPRDHNLEPASHKTNANPTFKKRNDRKNLKKFKKRLKKERKTRKKQRNKKKDNIKDSFKDKIKDKTKNNIYDEIELKNGYTS